MPAPAVVLVEDTTVRLDIQINDTLECYHDLIKKIYFTDLNGRVAGWEREKQRERECPSVVSLPKQPRPKLEAKN